jgi:hypothetical protein
VGVVSKRFLQDINMSIDHVLHNINGHHIAEITSQKVIINNEQRFLDIAMNLPVDCIIIHKENLPELFFDLRSGLAGEILQKVSNYRLRLGVVGDFTGYESESLRDFIYESNKSNKIIFVDTLEDALKRLSV